MITKLQTTKAKFPSCILRVYNWHGILQQKAAVFEIQALNSVAPSFGELPLRLVAEFIFLLTAAISDDKRKLDMTILEGTVQGRTLGWPRGFLMQLMFCVTVDN